LSATVSHGQSLTHSLTHPVFSVQCSVGGVQCSLRTSTSTSTSSTLLPSFVRSFVCSFLKNLSLVGRSVGFVGCMLLAVRRRPPSVVVRRPLSFVATSFVVVVIRIVVVVVTAVVVSFAVVAWVCGSENCDVAKPLQGHDDIYIDDEAPKREPQDCKRRRMTATIAPQRATTTNAASVARTV